MEEPKRQIQKRVLWTCFVLVCLGISLMLWFQPEEHGLQGLIKLVRVTFPDVNHIQPIELHRWLEDADSPSPVLLDVRTEPEYRVSHLKGAIRIAPDMEAARVLELLPDHNTPVVVYCSVGYRSSDLAARLIQHGFTNVYNLEGSIFSWVRYGFELENEGGPTDQVHGYNKQFEKILPKENRADLSRPE